MKRFRQALLAGIVVSALLVAILVARLDWTEFAAAFRRLAVAYLFAAAATIVLSIALRALRWQILSDVPRRLWVSVWYATVVGYIGNLIYPGRAGEVLRIAALHHLAQVEPGRAMASAFVDRLGDIIVLALVTVAMTTFIVGLPIGVVAASSIAAVVAICALVGFLAFGRRSAPLVERFALRLPNALAARVPKWYAQAVYAAHLCGSPRSWRPHWS